MPFGAVVGMVLAIMGGPLSMLFACCLGACGLSETASLLSAIPFCIWLCIGAALLARWGDKKLAR